MLNRLSDLEATFFRLRFFKVFQGLHEQSAGWDLGWAPTYYDEGLFDSEHRVAAQVLVARWINRGGEGRKAVGGDHQVQVVWPHVVPPELEQELTDGAIARDRIWNWDHGT